MLKILKNIWFYTTILLVSVYFVGRMNLHYYFSKDPEKYGEILGVQWHGWILRLAGLRIETDFSAIDPGGHYVFMSNHTSNMDIPAYYRLLGKAGYPVRFVAKQSLFEMPLFGNCMKGAGHIAIDRSNRRAGMRSMNEAVDRIKGGLCPIVFPEGTRSSDLTTLHKFKIGGMVMALKTGVPVVPVIIEGMGEVMPKGSMLIDNTKPVRIKALPPIDPGRYTLKEREQFKEDLFAIMNEAYLKMRAERAKD